MTHRCAKRCYGWPLAALLLALMPTAWAADSKGTDSSGSAKAAAAPDAAADGLTPDRPGFTNGSDTVSPGHVQVESGLTRTKYSAESGQGQATDAPEILVRTGLNATTELRLTLPNYVWPSGGKAGFSDGAVGIRTKLYQSKDGNTKVAFTPSLSVPIRSAVTVSGHVDPVLSLNAQTTSGARWGLSSNLILSYPTQNGGRLTDYTATGQVTYALTPLLSVYGDYYYDVPAHAPPSPIADGGLTYRIAKNVQLDVGTGRGLGGNALTQFYGGGIAVRF